MNALPRSTLPAARESGADLERRLLDVAAGPGSAEQRLISALSCLAGSIGAERAVIVRTTPRHCLASPGHGRRGAAATRALVEWVEADGEQESGRRYVRHAIPGAGQVVVGLEFADALRAAAWRVAAPEGLTQGSAAVIGLLSEVVAGGHEIAALRLRDAHQTRLISTVAHELRTPLTGLRGYLELIIAGEVNDPAMEGEFLERSRDIVASMDDLVGDLLELARMEAGTLRLDVEAFSVADVGRRVLNQLAPIALKREVALTAHLPPRLAEVRGDRGRVEQILRNLVGNALKFTPSGGSVEISGSLDGQVGVLTVRDDGHGIEVEDRGRIFERFYRMASHARVSGTGLGLPISRELARAMGGDLDVASIPRAGSSFILVLPASALESRSVVDGALQRALLAEERLLEHRAMLRRLQVLGDQVEPSRPHALRRTDRGSLATRRAARSGVPAAPVPLRLVEPDSNAS